MIDDRGLLAAEGCALVKPWSHLFMAYRLALVCDGA